MNLHQKTIVLTGGTSGIGLDMVRQLNADNVLIVIARPGPRLDALASDFPKVKTYGADLSNPQVYEKLVDDICKEHPKIDILINNAALQNTPRYLDDDFAFETIEPEIQLNFTAICALSYLFLPALMQTSDRAIIANINSGLALAPKTNSAVYCATKAGLDIFSQSLGYQLEETNVRVVQAFLPLVDTAMTTGRGTGKIAPSVAAKEILAGITKEAKVTDIGKVKILRFLLRLAPTLARNIMKGY